MNNFLIIHKQSNLIVNCFENEKPERIAPHHRLIPVSDRVLEKYFAVLAKHRDGTCIHVGEFALVSPSFLEALNAS